MEIKAADVAKLRKMTGAGMMDCKKALIEAEGDYAKAQDIIREKGKLVAAKRADRSATEGVVVSKIVGGKGYMLCLACETDFVAKNSEFSATANEILEIAVKADTVDLEALKAVSVEAGRTVADKVTEKSGQTGEKVELVYYAKIEAPMCVTYIHTNHKLGVLVGFNKEIAMETAKDVAMQAAAMAPIAIDRGDCDPAVVEKEREIGREQARLDGKPEAMLDKQGEQVPDREYAAQPASREEQQDFGRRLHQAGRRRSHRGRLQAFLAERLRLGSGRPLRNVKEDGT